MMPDMVDIEVNPDFKSGDSAVDKAQFAAAKKAGKISVALSTAVENIALSGGMYRIVPAIPNEVAAGPRKLSDMPVAELKILMLNLGIKTEKQMTRAQIEGLIQSRLDAIEVIEG